MLVVGDAVAIVEGCDESVEGRGSIVAMVIVDTEPGYSDPFGVV